MSVTATQSCRVAPARLQQATEPARFDVIHDSLASITHASIVAFGLTFSVAATAHGPRFYPDDPISEYPEPADASGVVPREPSETYDFLQHTFGTPGERVPRRAMNVNTIDEVPDSSWFTNRIGARAMSIAEVATGPNRSRGPARGRWTVVKAKTEGAAPGLVLRDAERQVFFVKFDSPGHAEMASGAEVISSKIFHALGYHVPETYIATIRREDLDIANDRERGAVGAADIDRVLGRAARNADGSYRMVVSKALPGKPLGPFAYHGTRPDDPNDIVPHEHRRELRAIRVFAAWVNNADVRSQNSLDTLIRVGGRSVVRHHLLDFGSTLGSGAMSPKSARSGHERLLDGRQSLIRLGTFGMIVPDWARIRYPRHPTIGRFEAEHFDPATWTPHYTNAAYHTMQPDDAFWAAQRVMAFSDEAIRAIVRTARYSDRAAEQYIADALIARRDRIGRAWLTSVNPIVDVRLGPNGVLTFENAAVRHGVASPPTEYRIRWAWFDNETQIATPFEAVASTRGTHVPIPRALLHHPASRYVRVEISALHPSLPSWSDPVHVYFRHDPHGWRVVGVERQPRAASART